MNRCELDRAAWKLGVTSTTLRQQGWTTTSPERVEAAGDNPPGWLVAALELARQRGRRRRQSTAAQLGIQVRAIRDRDIKPDEVGGLLATRPGWLVAEQERRQAQIVWGAEGRLRRELADALVTSVHVASLQELKHAVSDAGIDAINAQWAAEIRRVKQEARRLADGRSTDRVRARIARERDASYQAACYRAGQLMRRALEDSGA